MPRDEEPCVWGDTIRQAAPRRVNGEIIVERFPQSAGNGVFGRRWEKTVDPSGTVVNSPITTSGSIFDSDDPSSRLIRRKFAALGFFPLRRCPVALVMSGEMDPLQLDESLRQETPCKPGSYGEKSPCPHTLREIKMRSERHAKAMKSRIAKLEEADAGEIAAKNTKDLVNGITEAFSGTIRALLEAGMVRPPDEPSKGKSK